MTFQKPRIYYNNRLRMAQEGDDGTAYAACDETSEYESSPNSIFGGVDVIDALTIGDLVGCKAVFNTSGREYTIVDADATSSIIASVLAGYPSAANVKSVFRDVSGAYIIVVCAAAIFVLNASDLDVYDSAVIEAGTTAGCLSADGSYIFTTGAYGLNKYYLADLSLVASGTFLATELTPTGITAGDGYVCVCCSRSDNVGILVRFLTMTCTHFDSCAAGSGLNPTAIVLLSGVYVYMQCKDAGGVTIIEEFEETEDYEFFANSRTLTLAADEFQSAGMAVSATDLYVACVDGSDLGKLVKCDIATFTRTSVANSARYLPGGVALDGTNVYMTVQSATGNAGYIEKYALAGFPTLTSTFSSSYDGAGPLTLDSTYLYRVGLYNYATDFTIAEKVTISSMTASVARDMPNGAIIRALAEDDTYIYALAIRGNSGGTDNAPRVWRILRSNCSLIDYLDITRAMEITGGSMAYGMGYLYVGSTAYVTRINTADFSLSSEIAMAGGIKMIIAGGYFYTLENSSPSKVHRATTNPFAFVDTCTLAAGENTASDLQSNAVHIYVTCNVASGLLVKITAATMVRVGAVTVNGNPVAVTLDSSYIYTLGDDTPASISLVSLSGFALVDTINLAAGEDVPVDIFQYTSYVAAITNEATANTGRITRLRKGTDTLTRQSSKLYDIYDSLGVGMKMANSLTIAVTALQNGQPAVFYTSIYDVIVLDQTVSENDLGDGFEIRAGLSCAQADADNPAYNAADNSLVPLMLGTDNTQVKIRIHSPNLLEDGGLESGAFSPNWTASGAAWTVNTANKLEGAYSFKCDLSANHTLIQSCTEKLKAGVAYKLIYKAQAAVANAAAGLLTFGIYTPVTAAVIAVTSGDAEVAPEISTTAAWYEISFTPTKTHASWQFKITPNISLIGSTTYVILDEFYLYEAWPVNTLWADRHNWEDRAIVVNAWRLSPLRSTAASDAVNKTEIVSFTPDTSDRIGQALTSSTYPVIEIVLPAVSGFTAQAGEIYIGDYWEVPKYSGGLDPWETNDEGLREIKFTFKNIAPSYRQVQIERLFERLRAREAILVQWDTEAPLLMEDTEKRKSAPFDTYTVGLQRTFKEKI